MASSALNSLTGSPFKTGSAVFFLSAADGAASAGMSGSRVQVHESVSSKARNALGEYDIRLGRGRRSPRARFTDNRTRFPRMSLSLTLLLAESCCPQGQVFPMNSGVYTEVWGRVHAQRHTNC